MLTLSILFERDSMKAAGAPSAARSEAGGQAQAPADFECVAFGKAWKRKNR
jgi:hypothetical protein